VPRIGKFRWVGLNDWATHAGILGSTKIGFNRDRSTDSKQPNGNDRSALILAAVLVTVGMAGLFRLPSRAVVLFAGLVIAAWADDLIRGRGNLTALGVLALLTFPADFASASGRTLRRSRAVTGAVIGAVVGIFSPARRPDRPSSGGGLRIIHQRHLGKPGAPVSAQRWAGGVAAKLAIAFTMLGIFVIVCFATRCGSR
jgi:hypothetical protein